MIKAVGELSAPKGISLEVRIGLATGIVVVGDRLGSGPTQERAAVGETPNLAARVQAMAAPNSLVVSEATWRLAGPAFDYEDLGPRVLKGIPGAVRLWRVVGESSARGRFDARSVKGLTLVGRADEMRCCETLGVLQGWRGHSSGCRRRRLGKSRLSRRSRALATPPPCLHSWVPFIAQCTIIPTARRARLANRFAPGKSKSSSALLEALPRAADSAPLMVLRRSRREAIRAAINEPSKHDEGGAERMVILARGGPVLVLFEDAHWIDATSLEVMNGIIRRVVDLPVMIIVNYRPEFTPPWSDLGHSTMLRLNHLGRRQAVDLVRSSAGGKTLPETMVAQIVEKSQGVPLFVEEITRSVLESGDLEEHEGRYVLRQSVREFAIPPTLQES